MKNIHVIATDKPSKIGYHTDIVKEGRLDYAPNFGFSEFNKERNFQHRPHNIYITSDEQVKEGVDQWYLDKFLNKPRNSSGSQYGEKQDVIILTTDQDLIKDGIQAIDDEFLDWFVNNPSCEEVEVVGDDCYYEIIIPKEEPKQEHCDCRRAYKEVLSGICELCWDEKYPTKQETVEEEPKKDEDDKFFIDSVFNKQEAIEEAAERLSKNAYKKHSVKDDKLSLDEQIQRSGGFIVGFKEGMIDGAKWQQQRMYSEEEVLAIIFQKRMPYMTDTEIIEWFEQFKKK